METSERMEMNQPPIPTSTSVSAGRMPCSITELMKAQLKAGARLTWAPSLIGRIGQMKPKRMTRLRPIM
ncbi:hypothetical protein D3C87_1961140 [compost metagenome]